MPLGLGCSSLDLLELCSPEPLRSINSSLCPHNGKSTDLTFRAPLTTSTPYHFSLSHPCSSNLASDRVVTLGLGLCLLCLLHSWLQLTCTPCLFSISPVPFGQRILSHLTIYNVNKHYHEIVIEFFSFFEMGLTTYGTYGTHI